MEKLFTSICSTYLPVCPPPFPLSNKYFFGFCSKIQKLLFSFFLFQKSIIVIFYFLFQNTIIVFYVFLFKKLQNYNF